MPLCEKCGIIYEESSGDCPLCREVKAVSKLDSAPSSQRDGHIRTVIVFAAISTGLITFITDFAYSGSLTWASVPLLSLAYLTVIFLLISLLNKMRLLTVLLTVVSTSVFLRLLNGITSNGSDWFIGIATPILVLVLLLSLLFFTVRRIFRMSFTGIVTTLLTEAALLLIFLDAILSRELSWSLVTAAGIVSLIVFLIGFERRLQIKGSSLSKYFHT